MGRGTRRLAFFHAVTIASFFFFSFASNALAQAVLSPIISSISRASDAKMVLIVGKAQSNTVVTVDVISDDRGQMFQAEAPVDSEGKWELTIPDESFPAGQYTLRAIAYAPNGIASAPRDVRGSKMKPQPVLKAAGIDFGWLDVFIIVILLVVVAGSVSAWLHERSLRKREIARLTTDRDMHGMCTSLCDEVGKLPEIVRNSPGMDPRTAEDLDERVRKLQMTLEKMQGYLASEIHKFH